MAKTTTNPFRLSLSSKDPDANLMLIWTQLLSISLIHLFLSKIHPFSFFFLFFLPPTQALKIFELFSSVNVAWVPNLELLLQASLKFFVRSTQDFIQTDNYLTKACFILSPRCCQVLKTSINFLRFVCYWKGEWMAVCTCVICLFVEVIGGWICESLTFVIIPLDGQSFYLV